MSHGYSPARAGRRISFRPLRRVRPGVLFLQPRHRPHLAGRRSPRIRHRRHQRGHHLDRDRPLRRHEGKRHRPIWGVTGARNTASMNSSRSNTSGWAASTGKVRVGALQPSIRRRNRSNSSSSSRAPVNSAGGDPLRYSISLIGYLHATVLAGTVPSLVAGLNVHVATVVDTPPCTTVMTALVKAKS